MKNKTFSIILFAVLLVGVALTLDHFIYAINAYEHSSIIYFIGKELW